MATGQKVPIVLNATDKTKGAFTSVRRNMGKTSKEANTLAGRFRGVARATMAIEGPLGGTAGRLSSVATLLGNVSLATVGVTVAITAMSAAAFSSMKRFSQWEQQTFKINALLTQTNHASGLTGDAIEDMAIRIGKSTLQSSDDIRQASGILLSFKSVSGDAFERTIKLATDMAAITGNDMKSSMLQLGKALEQPMEGLTALRRSGISFTDAQKDMIVAMSKAGDTAGAQAATFELLEGQLGGAGAAQGGGLAGAADLVSENWNNMLTKFADNGAGKLATVMLNDLGNILGWLTHLVTDDNEAQKKKVNYLMEINSITERLVSLSEKKNKSAGDISEITRLAEKRKLMQDSIADIDKEAKAEADAAREKGIAQQKIISQQRIEDAQAKEIAKTLKEQNVELEKKRKSGIKYGESLAKELTDHQTSLLTKSQQEDVFYAERIAKIRQSVADGSMAEEEAEVAGYNSRLLYESKKTEAKKEENEKKKKADDDLAEKEKEALDSALGDISTLMAGNSKKLFKIGKAAAIAKATMNVYEAITKTMTSLPYPLNIAMAAGQAAAGFMQVRKIKATKPPARQHGGSVIAGRQYLVGERGAEMFTAGQSGRIVSNKTLNNYGGASNTMNITVVQQKDDPRTIQEIAWNGLLDRMNEEGLRFAR